MFSQHVHVQYNIFIQTSYNHIIELWCVLFVLYVENHRKWYLISSVNMLKIRFYNAFHRLTVQWNFHIYSEWKKISPCSKTPLLFGITITVFSSWHSRVECKQKCYIVTCCMYMYFKLQWSDLVSFYTFCL